MTPDVYPITGRNKLRGQLIALAGTEAGTNAHGRLTPAQLAGRLRVLADAYAALDRLQRL